MGSIAAVLGACIPPSISASEIDALRRDVDVQATRFAEMATEISGQTKELRDLEEAFDRQEGMLDYLATRQPVVIPPTPTTLQPTPYRPVWGGVVLEDGRCCAGGKAGEVIEISVEFFARSPLAEVEKMRYRLGQRRAEIDELSQTDWRPFRERLTVPVQVSLNWVGYTISVQFMDAVGNLSPVYYDEISVEGIP